MDAELILHKLRQTYGIKEKHVLLVRQLQDGHPRSADELSKAADIPLGRVYSYLNELVEMQLVTRTGRKPYQYSIPKFSRAVIDFMRSRMSNYVQTESEVLDLMKGGAEHIDLIKTRADYTRAHLNVIEESMHIRLTCFHRSFPFLLYPDDFEDFIRLRRSIVQFRPTISYVDPEALYVIYRAYQQALARNAKFEVIVEKWTILDHLTMVRENFSPEFVKSYVAHIRKRAKTASIRVIEEYLPMEIDLGEKLAVLALSHLDMSTGIVSRSDAVRVLYSTLFDQKKVRTKDVTKFLGV